MVVVGRYLRRAVEPRKPANAKRVRKDFSVRGQWLGGKDALISILEQDFSSTGRV